MIWITPERLIYVFFHPTNAGAPLNGLLKEIRDFNGNKVLFDYDPVLGRLQKVTDTASGVWTFIYNGQGQLFTVSGQGWTVTFVYETDGRLKNFSHTGPISYVATPPRSTEWSFGYTQSAEISMAWSLTRAFAEIRWRNASSAGAVSFGFVFEFMWLGCLLHLTGIR